MSGETEQEVSGWTVDTLKAHIQSQILDLRQMLDERYDTQTKALDAAFLAQQLAMQTALTAAEKAVATALESAEKAVTKAELAADKRFESVNEFRAQLADQAATLMSRSEADIRFNGLEDKLTSVGGNNTARIAEIEKRLNLTQGETTGAAGNSVTRRAEVTMTVAIIGVLISLCGLAAVIIIALTR